MIVFAHRGAPRHREEENTLPAFERAIALGASGLESDIALTVDGIPVLTHPRLLARRLRIAETRLADLPPHIPSLESLYERCGNAFHLSLDMAAPGAVDAVVAVADRHGARERLWLTYWRLSTLAQWRGRWSDVHLVYPSIPVFPRRLDTLLGRLRDQRVDVLNVHHRFCTLALGTRVHAAGLQVFAWGVRRRGQIARVARAGVEGVFCDDLEP